MIDWAAIVKIIGVDIMLGVDNAIVIALACATLPAHLRGKAVVLGTAGAVALRAILLAFAGLLMGLHWVKLIAGVYLIYIGYKLLLENDEDPDVKGASNLWGAVRTIIIADFMMSLDNVLAVSAASQSAGSHSTLYAIAGIIFSIPVIIFGATAIMGLMKKFPIIVWIGAGMLGWVGAEMILSEPVLQPYVTHLHHILGKYTDLIVKVLGFAIVVVSAYIVEKFVDHKDPTITT